VKVACNLFCGVERDRTLRGHSCPAAQWSMAQGILQTVILVMHKAALHRLKACHHVNSCTVKVHDI